MKKLSTKLRRRQLRDIAALADDRIDTSDIPELTEEQLRRAIHGRMYRPVKKPVTIRLDTDVIAWLKQGGPGYQTKANALLRRQMLASQQKKTPSRAARVTVPRAKARNTRGR